jgi:hypothetical protein
MTTNFGQNRKQLQAQVAGCYLLERVTPVMQRGAT